MHVEGPMLRSGPAMTSFGDLGTAGYLPEPH